LSTLLTLIVCAEAVLTRPALAGDADASTSTTAPVDKSQYNLFNPTPREQMRDFNSNRPDTTEGPYTVDAGHVQVEASFAEYTLAHDEGTPFGTRTQTISVAPTTFRIGVLNQVEADVIFNPFIYQRSQTGTATDYTRGFGDMTLRAAINLWGNDSGTTAFGLIPFVQLPTASTSSGLGTGRVQGGLIFPFQLNLPHDWGIGAMLEFDALRNDANTHYGFDVVHSIVLSHGIVKNLEGFVEYVGIAPHDLGASYQAFFDTGVSYQLTENLEVDCAVDVGLSKDTPDYTLVAGFAVRI
jgi:hypothetical protein